MSICLDYTADGFQESVCIIYVRATKRVKQHTSIQG